MNNRNFLRVWLLAVFAFTLTNSVKAQTISIGQNQYAFQFTGNPNFGLFFNSSDAAYEFKNGSGNSIFSIKGSNGALKTNLSFEPGSDLTIADNNYAFRAQSNSNFGLYFDGDARQYQFLNGSAAPIFAISALNGRFDSNIRFNSGKNLLIAPGEFAARSSVAPEAGLVFGTSAYEFRSASGVPVFSVNASSGNTKLAGGLTLGSSTVEETGSIRYNGGDFEGFDGAAWTSLTEGTPGPQGPQGIAGAAGPQGEPGPEGPQGSDGFLPAGATNAVPYHDGSDWQVNATNITNNGTSVGVGRQPDPNARLAVQNLEATSAAGRSVIRADRAGLVNDPGTLTSWFQADAAISGVVDWGNSYSAGIFGRSVLDFKNSAAVVGYRNNATFAGLAYRDDNNDLYAGYFQGNVSVNGEIKTKAIRVTLSGFPDYVFDSAYDLMPLADVESFIREYGHLPNMPSEAEVVKNGLGLGEINVILVEKVEELTLHLIQKEKDVTSLTNENKEMKERLAKLEAFMNEMITKQ